MRSPASTLDRISPADDVEQSAFQEYYEQRIVAAPATLDAVNELLIELRQPSFDYGRATVSASAAQLEATIINRGVDLSAEYFQIDPLDEPRRDDLRQAYSDLITMIVPQIFIRENQLDSPFRVDDEISLTPRMIFGLSRLGAAESTVSEAGDG